MNDTLKYILRFFLKPLAVFLFSLMPFISLGQSWYWTATAGGPESDKGLDIDIDRYGNQYVCGFYNHSSSAVDISFGAINPPSSFGKEGFISKIDSSGNWIWVREAIGGWDERILGLCVDNVNDVIYATGTCWNYTYFYTCPSPGFSYGSDNIFIGKFDLSGNCLWLLLAGASGDDHGFDMITDKLGNVYLTGYISDKYGMGGQTGLFGTLVSPVIPTGDSLAFVTKISPSGTFQWVSTFEATDGERDNRIAIDSMANVYVTGGFHGTSTFGPYTITSNGARDIFVLKMDSSGTIQWVSTAGSTLSDRANSVTVDKFQDIYITGEFRDKLAFGTDSLNNNGGPSGRDVFVAKIDKNGTWKWGKKAGSKSGSEKGNRITSSKQGLLFVTGQIKDSTKFGSAATLPATDSIQIFVAAIDTSGKWQWAIQAGSPVEDRGTGIVVDDSCNIYVCGYYEETALFDSMSMRALGRKDIFVAKIPVGCTYVPVITIPPPDPEPLSPECYTIVANVFTPNGDDFNDVYSIEGNCFERLSFSIYNRWGVNIKNIEGAAIEWDGKMTNGAEAADGVYYYVGQIEYVNGELVDLKGFIMLNR